jgi:NADPH:quinone reductase-like Zn-dependent oxidoreductase
VAPKPVTVDHVQAAAVPQVGLTAWQALFDHGKLSKGQTVIIHGAGGTVGSTAVQLARWAAATARSPCPTQTPKARRAEQAPITQRRKRSLMRLVS